MDIREMHITFREFAQQMGMQKSRSILPEDIDICLNYAINYKVRSAIIQNVGENAFPDKIIRQNSIITPINAIRSLYKKLSLTQEGDFVYWYENSIDGDKSYTANISQNNIMLYTGFRISYGGKYYDCRIIESEDLANTLNDYCNQASYDYPVIAITGDKEEITINLYIGKTKKELKTIEVLYIKTPNKVKYSDDADECVNCDLPDYIHTDIIDLAVNKYLSSVQRTSQPINNNQTT